MLELRDVQPAPVEHKYLFWVWTEEGVGATALETDGAVITADGWFDWAIRYPGPIEKSGYWPGINESDPVGVVYHSAEGSAASLLSLVTNLQRQASWTASNMKDGKFYQHYPVRRVVWTNGSMLANVKFRGIESEGVAGEVLTVPQTANLTRAASDMRDFFGWEEIKRPQAESDWP